MDGSPLTVGGKAKCEDATAGQGMNVMVGLCRFLLVLLLFSQ